MATTITNVRDISSAQADTIQVVGTIDGSDEITAFGWISAMANYFPPDAYYASDATPDSDGNIAYYAGDRKPDVAAREMTSDEKMSYWQGLLEAQAPQIPTAVPAPATVLFP